MARDLQRRQGHNDVSTSAPDVDVDAEHDPVVSRRASNAALRREASKYGGDSAAGHQPLPHAERIQASFGHHDISDTRALIGGDAAQASNELGAKAFAHGDTVSFGASPDLWLAAHEAAHVVQQKRGVSPAGGMDGGSKDPLEQNANAVADAVVAGRSAQPLLDGLSGSGGPTHAVQRFVEREHKSLGDEGSGNRMYTYGPLELTHGDLVMLSGDHFSPEDLQSLLGKPSPYPGAVPGTQDEIICVLHNELGKSDPRFAPGGKWEGITFSAAVKKSVEDRYYKLAAANYRHFPNPKAVPGVAAPESAGAVYESLHQQALARAYRAGAEGKSITEALTIEGSGQHFLTDSFSSGHIATPRTTAKQYWSAKYPNFGQQFVERIADEVASQLAKEASGLSTAIPLNVLESQTKKMIKEKLDGKPTPSLGDIVSVATHGSDNAEGLAVTNDVGWHWKAYGDHHLEVPSAAASALTPSASRMTNRDVAVEAVRLGIEDVEKAYALGKSANGQPMSNADLFAAIKAQTSAPARPGSKFGAEQLTPSVDNSTQSQGHLNFMASSIAELWNTQIRTTRPETFGEFIFKGMSSSGEFGGELESMKNGLPEKINPFEMPGVLGLAEEYLPGLISAEHGHLFPRSAFAKAILEPLRKSSASCLKFFQSIVGE